MRFFTLLPIIPVILLLFSNCGNNSFTPITDIHDAVNSGSSIAIRQALLSGSDINETDHEGNTALYNAVKANKLKLVKTLLESNANPNTGKNNSLITALLLQTKN